MIYLITGQNGHGKTLRAMQLALEYKAAGREVFLCNFNGVDYEKTGFKELVKLEDWQDCPDGSVILVDECWEFIPARAVGKHGPKWERDLAVHRHRGLDFIFICQAGTQISTHVRALVHEHTHVRRKWGTQKAMLLTWDRFQPSTASTAEVRDARKKVFLYPKSIFGIYKSATVHTAQRNLPWQMFAIPVLAAIIIGIGWLVFHRFKSRGKVEQAVAEAPAPAGGAAAAPHSAKAEVMTAGDYAVKYAPRIAAMPWSAPWHDDAKPRADPDIYCVISEVRGCLCYSEQITSLQVPALQCFQIARNGVYNPFRASTAQQLDTTNPGLRDQHPGRRKVGDLEDIDQPHALGSLSSYQSLPVPQPPPRLAREPVSLKP